VRPPSRDRRSRRICFYSDGPVDRSALTWPSVRMIETPPLQQQWTCGPVRTVTKPKGQHLYRCSSTTRVAASRKGQSSKLRTDPSVRILRNVLADKGQEGDQPTFSLKPPVVLSYARNGPCLQVANEDRKFGRSIISLLRREGRLLTELSKLSDLNNGKPSRAGRRDGAGPFRFQSRLPHETSGFCHGRPYVLISHAVSCHCETC
jgi:hypothetical protein